MTDLSSNEVESVSQSSSSSRIFIIGFNKCGTTSIHQVFARSGIPSAHYAIKKRNIALMMTSNWALGRRAMEGVEDYCAFSDMIYLSNNIYIEGCRYFKLLHDDYPDAFFILNTRDVDRWIESRLRHRSVTNGSQMISRASQATGLLESEVISYWRSLYHRHICEVREYFKDYPRFLEFDIDNDNAAKITDFLAPTYSLDATNWGRVNTVAERRAIESRRFDQVPVLKKYIRHPLRKINERIRKWSN